MRHGIKSVDELFEAFGGPAAFARIIGKNPSTASMIKRRGSIAIEYWPFLIESEQGKSLGLSADDLMWIHILNADVKPRSKHEVPSLNTKSDCQLNRRRHK